MCPFGMISNIVVWSSIGQKQSTKIIAIFIFVLWPFFKTLSNIINTFDFMNEMRNYCGYQIKINNNVRNEIHLLIA